MMTSRLLCATVACLLSVDVSFAFFVPGPSNLSAGKSCFKDRTSPVRRNIIRDHAAACRLRAGVLDADGPPGGESGGGSVESSILLASLGVGGVTALLGFLYGKILGTTRRLIWNGLPSTLASRGVPVG
eukprot:CAMPEP_0194291738 /NCGR_PEP_ID=MMETSP0169-20130528/44062_1 /TAXON_ID=218684 /ORGANISM="Corethron pennatum, Strain L29A3" /LENGTH=128 /DNA_ID=CAMNT_0039039711 /DNA_START=14 /DNA_END=396 /DNA_ORIENTATION=+